MIQAEIKSLLREDISILIKTANSGKHYLCDCGEASLLTVKEAQAVSALFISHTHIDHFSNFDGIFRHQIGSGEKVLIAGPKNIHHQVEARLKSYTWNLINEKAIEYEIREIVSPEEINVYVIRPPHWNLELVKTQSFLFEDEQIKVDFAILDHKTDSIAYLFQEKIEKLWNGVETIQFEEFFESTDRNLRLFCFNYIGVGNLMNRLEAEKINEEEVELNYNEYDQNGNKTQIRRINHYEVYKIENKKLGIYTWRETDQYSYAVKCWCPSTEKEHWLWIEQEYKGNALTAVASTFRIHENIIPYIKCLKRQGDLLICELEREVTPRGFPRALTASEYFSLLEVEA